jgi:tetratricopeptide (TPR) repeat protein
MSSRQLHQLVIGIWSLVIAALAPLMLPAQESPTAAAPAAPAKPPLLERTPFDQIILNKVEGGATLEVLPLSLPERPLRTMPKEGGLQVRLLDRPTEDFAVAWTSIAQIRVFEQMLLEEAQRLVAAGKFDQAYDYFGRLRVEYPNLGGLDNAISDYLMRNATAVYKANQHDRALALLLSLHQRNPRHAGLPEAVQSVAGEIIQRYLREGNYAAARRVLDVWRTQFHGVATQAADEWQRRFEDAAGKQIDEAARLVGQKQYIPARQAVSRALAIWPALQSAAAMLAQIQREFPFVTVGVLETAPREPTRRIDDWATLRTARLTQRLLAEQIDFGGEGGVYQSPFGEINVDETGRELTFKLHSAGGGPTVDELSRYLLSTARRGAPHFRPDLAALLGGISVAHSDTITLYFRHEHVRPAALLQMPPPGAKNQAGAYAVAAFSPDQVVLARREGAEKSTGPQAIVEQTITSDEAAITALQTGELDVLDRVPPWQVERLRELRDVHVGTYKLPTVHVLIPNLKRPLMAKREFRRALCFGIDRKWIVERVLLGGTAMQGFQAISGPLPAGASLNDPIRYGYDANITARPFEPRLASILATVAWAAVQNPPEKAKEKDKEKDTGADVELPEIVLAHPNDPIARIACQSIQAQLVREEIPVTLREFTAEELAGGKVDYDLRYAELTIGEPLTDMRLVVGPNGLAGDLQSPYLDAALRDLDTAANWKEVRARLAQIHDIAHHELPVIPLWQTINFFAYRGSVRGIAESPIALYQNIDQWTLAPPTNVATAEPRQP